jgi:hypothetical protein
VQDVILDREVIVSVNVFYSPSSAQNSVIEFKTHFVINFNFQSISFVIFLYVMYYTLLLR